MNKCSLDGCDRAHYARGICHAHYERARVAGTLRDYATKPRSSGWLNSYGYKLTYRDGAKISEHRLVAERALGRPLPVGAVVHHVDEDRLNNASANLVICPDEAYHQLIHRRMRALAECGHASWRRCPYCKTYDDPLNMRDDRGRFVHRKCVTLARKGLL